MISLTSKEFVEQLNANTLKSPFALKGIVKKSGKDAEILFAGKEDLRKWITIPSSMIESAIVLKTFTKEDQLFAVVKLHLKKPATPEGQVYYELLSLLGKDEMKEGKCKSGDGHHHGHHCGCDCHYHHHSGCAQGHC